MTTQKQRKRKMKKRNMLVVHVMRKGVRKHKNLKREAVIKGQRKECHE